MKFIYDVNKYNVSNFLDNKKLLGWYNWYSLNKSKNHEYKELKVNKVENGVAFCAYREYDYSVKKLVDVPAEYPAEDICLYKYVAVNFEFNKAMDSLEPEMAEFIRSLVESKEDTARCAGYNGCI